MLEYWTAKKKRLDQNQQFCLFERSARQSLAWIKEEGDIYLSTHTNVGNNREETLALLEEHNSFKVTKITPDISTWEPEFSTKLSFNNKGKSDTPRPLGLFWHNSHWNAIEQYNILLYCVSYPRLK